MDYVRNSVIGHVSLFKAANSKQERAKLGYIHGWKRTRMESDKESSLDPVPFFSFNILRKARAFIEHKSCDDSGPHSPGENRVNVSCVPHTYQKPINK